MKYSLSDLIDLESFQDLLRSYAAVSGLTCALVDAEGNILANAGWQNICGRFHNVQPEMEKRCLESDRLLMEKIEDGHSHAEMCLNGLWDTAAPIIIEGESIGVIYTGQFLKEPADEEAFRAQARQFGLDEEAYIEDLQKVPVVTQERVDATLVFFNQLANNLARIGLERMRRIEANEKRDQAEKARQEAEAFHKLLVERVQPVIYLDMADSTSSNRYTSPQVESLLGYTPDEWLADPDLWIKTVHPLDLERVQAENERTNLTGEPFKLEYRMITKDGRVIWVSDQAVKTSAGAGELDGWWGVLNDITKQKEAEGIIRKAEIRTATLMSLNQMLLATEKEITDFTLKAALEITDSPIGYIAFASSDETKLYMMSWSESALEECRIVDKILEYQVDQTGLWGEAVRQRKAVITNDYQGEHPSKKGTPEGHVRMTCHMNVPVFEGELIVLVAGVGNKAVGYTDADVQQLSSLMDGMWGIILRRRAQEAMQQRILTLTKPAWDLSSLRFEDLFDIAEIQNIQDVFAQATGVASIISDVNGKPITAPSNYCKLCDQIIRKTELGLQNCTAFEFDVDKVLMDRPVIQPCSSGGLWNAGTSIVVGEHHIANWLIGQVLDDSIDEEEFLAYARQIGADEDAYRAALRQVNRMSPEKFQAVSNALFTIARKLSQTALQNVQQARIIAERQRAEETLSQERTLLRTLVYNLPDAMYIKDAEGRKTLTNPADLEIIGASSEAEVLGKTDLELFGPEAGERTYRDDMEIISSGKAKLRYEESIIDRQGVQRWLQTSKVPLLDEKGKVISLLGIGRDVTDHRRALDALTSERKLLRAFSDNTPDQIFVKDRESRFVLCNPAVAQAMFTSSTDDIIGKTDFDFHTPEMAAQFYQQEQTLMRTGIPILGQEQHFVDANGNMRWFITTKVPWKNEQGEIIGLFGINHDNSERRANQETIVRERNLLRVLVEHIPDQIYVKDVNSRFIIGNLPTARGFQFSTVEELLGKTDFDVHPPDKAQQYFEEEQRLLVSGELMINVERWDTLSDGTKKWLNVTKVPWRNEKGEIVGLVGINRDLTERKQAEDEIRNLNTQLEQRVIERTAELTAANRELEDFAYSVSHDLRSPLRGIDGFSQALLEEFSPQLDESGRHYLDRIRAGSQRMGQIIDDLLKLSRVTRVNLKRETVDLTGLAKAILFDLRMAQSERKVEIVIQPGLKAQADPNLIRMVMNNLLDNAWKFTSKQTTARIEVGKMDLKGMTVYYVRDDGVGFDMAYADKLFGTFQRLHHLTEYDGTGIGLAIVQRVIQRHGGSVWAESGLGKGTTIYFTL